MNAVDALSSSWSFGRIGGCSIFVRQDELMGAYNYHFFEWVRVRFSCLNKVDRYVVTRKV